MLKSNKECPSSFLLSNEWVAVTHVLKKSTATNTQASLRESFKIKACTSSPCLNNGKCLESNTMGYTCVCDTSYYGNNCENAFSYKYTSKKNCEYN